jgi:hypothetical protein
MTLAIIVTVTTSACTRHIEGGDAPAGTETTTTELSGSTVAPTIALPTTTTGSPPTVVSTTTTTVAPSTTTTLLEDDGPGSIYAVRPPSDLPAPPLPPDWTTAVIGTSGDGRDIAALVRPVSLPRHTVLVIGGLHGNEPVTPPSVWGMFEAEIPAGVEVWLLPTANPDGSAAGMRCNAHGVDLNRNFSWEWRPDDGGPAPSSEPETQAITAMVEGLQPDLVVWVHQPLDYVSAIGPTASELEEAWAGASGLPVRADVTQHGGGESWSAFVAGVPSMLIEIGGWEATPEIVAAQRAGFVATLTALR